MKKTFLLDTNILMQTPNAIFGFADNDVYVTGITLQELDAHKNDNGEAGYNTREAIRIIYGLKELGDYRKGIPLENGGRFFIETNGINAENLPVGYDIKLNDNKIISAAITMSKSVINEFVLVTNDVSMAINATVAGLNVQSYKNTQAKSTTVFKGYSLIDATKEVIDTLYKDAQISIDTLNKKKTDFTENEYIILKCGQQSAITVYSDGNLCRVDTKRLNPMGIKGKNSCSHMALDALMKPAEDLPLVFLIGPAGCGKTFLSLACGLHATQNNGDYFRVMITRNNVLSDEELGFLPGTLEEKMSPLIMPFMDNLRELLRDKKQECNQAELDELFDNGIIEICSMAYMRGRSLTDVYLIIDEAQNATPGQIMEVITRAGEGTKIVICGDPDQIDNPRLDKRNNGLVVAAEKMAGSPLCAQIVFSSHDTVRSPLAKEAAERLKKK